MEKYIKTYKRFFFEICGGILLVIVIVAAIIYHIHNSMTESAAEKNLHRIPLIETALFISPNGTTRASGIVISSINNGVIIATGDINNVPVSFTIATQANTSVVMGQATSSINYLSPGQVVIVTGLLRSFVPISIVASNIQVLGIKSTSSFTYSFIPTRTTPITSSSSTLIFRHSSTSTPHKLPKAK